MDDTSINTVMTDLMDIVRSKTDCTTQLSITDASEALMSIGDHIISITVSDTSNPDIAGVYVFDRDSNRWNKYTK